MKEASDKCDEYKQKLEGLSGHQIARDPNSDTSLLPRNRTYKKNAVGWAYSTEYKGPEDEWEL